jgi:DMSO/TMAO reductase YedYZ molybdopterin-dependent catalytic subunit
MRTPEQKQRRTFLIRLLGAGAGLGASAALAAACRHPLLRTLGVDGSGELPDALPALGMARFPEKENLILLTDRPPQLETPLYYFRQDLTPNSAFFVRWHLSGLPTTVDLRTFRLNVAGHVKTPLSLSFHELATRFPAVSMVAVNQCSGNSRSYYDPPVPGGQWKHGAMGNARWTGVRLRDLLEAAGVRAGAVQVAVHGLDRPPLTSTPLFEKSLAIDHARDGEVMVAYAMNDEPLPVVNGFPIRLVVPGWYGTYWVKALSHVIVSNEPYRGYWTDTAYRIPVGPDAQELPTDLAKKTEPINRFSVRSIFVRPEPEETIPVGRMYDVEGVAVDDGSGISRVEISFDGTKSWTDAHLDPPIDKYSWRRFRLAWTPPTPGGYTLACRATNAAGRTQTIYQWNRSGFARNEIEKVAVHAVA